MNSVTLPRSVLVDLAAVGVTLSFDRGQLFVTRPKAVASPSKFAAALGRLREHKDAVIALCWCLRCARDVRDEIDRQRLVGVNPFCGEGGCPFRHPR